MITVNDGDDGGMNTSSACIIILTMGRLIEGHKPYIIMTLLIIHIIDGCFLYIFLVGRVNCQSPEVLLL